MFDAMQAQMRQQVKVSETTFIINRGVHVSTRTGARLNVIEKYSPVETLTYYVSDSMLDSTVTNLVKKEKAKYEQS